MIVHGNICKSQGLVKLARNQNVIVSENAHLCLLDVPRLCLWDVEEVEDAIVAHHGQPVILLVKGDRLEPFVHFDLR